MNTTTIAIQDNIYHAMTMNHPGVAYDAISDIEAKTVNIHCNSASTAEIAQSICLALPSTYNVAVKYEPNQAYDDLRRA